MSKHVHLSRRSQLHADQLPIAPADVRRLRSRLHPGDHVVLNRYEVHTVLSLIDLLSSPEPAMPPTRRAKPAYQRQQHRSIGKNKRQ